MILTTSPWPLTIFNKLPLLKINIDGEETVDMISKKHYRSLLRAFPNSWYG